MTPQEQIEIIQAYERGEEIEYKCKFDRYGTYSWIKVPTLNKKHQFNFNDYVYRIKPKPKRWRAEMNGKYYFITVNIDICECFDTYCCADTYKYNAGNYFRTLEDAAAVLEELKACIIKIHEDDE